MSSLTIFEPGAFPTERNSNTLRLSRQVRRTLAIRIQQMQGTNLLAQVALEEISHLHRKAGTEIVTTAAFYDLLKRIAPDGLKQEETQILDQLWRLYEIHIYKVTGAADSKISGSIPGS